MCAGNIALVIRLPPLLIEALASSNPLENHIQGKQTGKQKQRVVLYVVKADVILEDQRVDSDEAKAD